LLPVSLGRYGVYECVDCKRSEGPMYLHHPDYVGPDGASQGATVPLAPSLQRRLEAWLAGEDLVHQAISELDERRRARQA
jgi:hypothetical protein